MKVHKIKTRTTKFMLCWLICQQFCLGILPYSLTAATSTRVVAVQSVHVTNDPAALEATIELNGIAAFTHSTLTQPMRIIVDIKAAVQVIHPLQRADEQIILPVGAGGLERVRIGQMGNSVRVVFDVNKLNRYQVERQGTNLLVHFTRSSKEPANLNQSWSTLTIAPPQPRQSNAGEITTSPTKPQAINTVLPASSIAARTVVPAPAPPPTTAPIRPGTMPELKAAEKEVSVREGRKNFSEGMRYEALQKWEQAAQQFIVAAAAEPHNPEYQLHLLRARQNAALLLAGRGDALAEQNDYASAYRAYRQAAAYDDTNDLVRVKMQRMATQQALAASGRDKNFNPHTGNFIATRADIALPQRAATPDMLQVIHFESANLRQVLERFGADLGLNVLFDESFRDEDKFRFKVQNVTLARALDMILVQTKHLFEQIDRRTILIYSDTPANRQRFEQLLVKTFYLASADSNEVKATIQQMVGAQRQIAVIKQLNALIVRDTVGNLKMIQEIIDSVDKNRAEVVVDVNIYEVSRSTSLEIGNQLSLSTTPVTETRFDKDGKPLSFTAGSAASLSNLGGVGRAGLATIAGNTVSPVLGGVGTLLGLPPSSLSLLQSKGNSKLLASTQIHALDGEQNQTKVGRSVPVRIGSTFVPGLANTGTNGNALGGLLGGAFDSIQYRDVGLVIEVTPTVSNEGFVQLRLRLESTSVEASGADISLTPSFSQRSLNTIARVVDGKTAVVAGIKQESKGESRAGIPVLSMLPVLGRFITTPRQNSNLSDVLITVTPHILRAPELKQEDHLAKFSGTLTAGVSQSIEDVALRAQSEDDQERKLTNRQSIIARETSRDEVPTSAASTSAALAQPETTTAFAVSSPLPLTPINSPLPTPQQTLAAPADQAMNLVDLSLLPNRIEAEVGGSFFVVASAYGQAHMNEARLTLYFDPKLVEFKSVRSGGLLGRHPAIKQELKEGELEIRVRQVEDRDTPIAASGQLVLLEFTALSDGETFIMLKREATDLRRGHNPLQFTHTNAQVIIGKELSAPVSKTK